ncbi:unnamed protein product, partial [Mesorhabditis belari]|uniref:Uncharacterized protein n=1 Tax=Mesorhabditis belari TaxID=2138241 RepID=A0AAF3EGS5_9BILA
MNSVLLILFLGLTIVYSVINLFGNDFTTILQHSKPIKADRILESKDNESTISSEPLPSNDEIFVSFGGNADPYFIDALPIVAMAWIQLGVRPLVCLVGSKEDYQSNELKPIIEYLEKLNVTVTYLPGNYTLKTASLSQHCRLYAATSNLVSLDSVVIVSDIDYIPFHLNEHWVEDVDLFIYNSLCCGETEMFEHKFPHYPISTIALRKRGWLELLELSHATYENGTSIEGDLLAFFDKDMLDEHYFRLQLFRELQGHPFWYSDQKLTSFRIFDWKRRTKRVIRTGEYNGNKERIDRDNWPSDQILDTINLYDFNDAHLLRPISANWYRLQAFFKKLFKPDLYQIAESYGLKMNALSRTYIRMREPSPIV